MTRQSHYNSCILLKNRDFLEKSSIVSKRLKNLEVILFSNHGRTCRKRSFTHTE